MLKTRSPVYSLILGTKTLIVLSSETAVKDLLDKRSDIYSDRPDAYIGQDLISGGLRLVLMVSRPTIPRTGAYHKYTLHHCLIWSALSID